VDFFRVGRALFPRVQSYPLHIFPVGRRHELSISECVRVFFSLLAWVVGSTCVLPPLRSRLWWPAAHCLLDSGHEVPVEQLRYFVSGLAAPVVAFIGTLLFSLALPFAAITTHALRAEDVIRATNGPAHYVFLGQPRGMIALPPYFAHTPQTNRDYLRSHVALLYLTDKEHVYFLKMAYPQLYEEFQEQVSNL
jgi:hypothetical protein